MKSLFSRTLRSRTHEVCDICSAVCDNVVETGRYRIPLAHCEQCVQKMVHELLQCNKVLKSSCDERGMRLAYNHSSKLFEVYAFEDGKDVLVLSTKNKQSAEGYLDHIEGNKQNG